MSAAQHAPGPWALKMYTSFGGERQVLDQLIDATGRSVRFAGVTISSGDECEANTRLISVAPEMLQLLMDLYEHGEVDPCRLNDLIAKATRPVSADEFKGEA